MKAKDFVDLLNKDLSIDYYVGVPDSYLRAFCDYITDSYGVGDAHVIAENEGGAVGLAAGHYLATGKPALVYMQNSGLGNVVNPICSLLWPYKIPALFLIGWRGEPGVHDEPQHTFQGEITTSLLDCLEVPYFIMSPEVSVEQFEQEVLPQAKEAFEQGKQFALVCRKKTFETDNKRIYKNDYPMARERAVEVITRELDENTAIVSTTGKLSRELFETREKYDEPHKSDFLIVGSMGHTSMIGAGVACAQPKKPVAILDGDGSCLMHMGALPILASLKTQNVLYFVFNNGAHETVGGMPIASQKINYHDLALSCGFASYFKAEDEEDLKTTLPKLAQAEGPVFCEVCVSLGSRADLGRPTETPIQCRDAFMNFVQGD